MSTKIANEKTIVLAAGGTGGHLFPALALAQEMKDRGWRAVLVIDRRVREFATVEEVDAVYTIRAGRLGGGIINKCKGLMNIALGSWQARRLLKRLRPAVVAGFGGYPSFPTVLAAEMRHLPTLIHEQNAVLGRANQALAGRADVIATSFAEMRGLEEPGRRQVVTTGNPVRQAIWVLKDVPYAEPEPDGTLRLLVIGGSLGASVFSKIVPEAIALLPTPLRQRVRIEQQCRAENIEATRQRYNEMDIQADLAPFFRDIPARLASAHLVISRAGASSVAELMAAGRPSVLVPFPDAMDDHQAINADAIEECGGGWVMPEAAFTPEALAARLEAFLNLPETLTQAATCLKNVRGDKSAAARLADVVEDMAAGRAVLGNSIQQPPVLASETVRENNTTLEHAA